MKSDFKSRLDSVRVYLQRKIIDARTFIYEMALPITGAAVENILKPTSLVPTMVCGDYFYPYLSLTHFIIVELVCRAPPRSWYRVRSLADASHRPHARVWAWGLENIIHTFAPGALCGLWPICSSRRCIQSTVRQFFLNNYPRIANPQNRFRLVPTFGTHTIRRFKDNVSEMKKFAARDYEDILQVKRLEVSPAHSLLIHMQCAIPVFEGLLDEPYNTMLMQLLYRAAEWHALAKLRMHTKTTLDLLEKCTIHLGQLMRKFRNVTFLNFNTVVLPREARKSPSASGKRKPLNLNTYKFHSLGDYVRTIKLFGCTDSFSTQLVSRYLISEHQYLLFLHFFFTFLHLFHLFPKE